MIDKDISSLLSKITYFKKLDPQYLQCINDAALRRTFEEGQQVFLEGDPCIGLYIVESGWARAVKRSSSGREQAIRFVGPGDVFNEVGVMTGGMNVVTVEALEPISLIIVQREMILDLVDCCPSLARVLIENLAQRVHYAMNMVVGLSLHSVESRLARFILTQAQEDQFINRKKWTTQAFIAAQIGTVPVVINRAFCALVEDNLIELTRNYIRILDTPGLLEIASVVE
ncbi:MAG: Crp/Fnr family transcriptional regulator [Anaerolineales bacterium]|nr:Crp/Fnr family transcriptional regulator [Anaerolineales bacterium]